MINKIELAAHCNKYLYQENKKSPAMLPGLMICLIMLTLKAGKKSKQDG
jgi:hypothetical protein